MDNSFSKLTIEALDEKIIGVCKHLDEKIDGLEKISNGNFARLAEAQAKHQDWDDERVTDVTAIIHRRIEELEKLFTEKYIRLQEVQTKHQAWDNERMGSMKEVIQVALTSADKAIAKAEQATEKRFDSVNEFRNTLADQTAEFVRKSEADLKADGLSDRIDATNEKLDTLTLRLTTIDATSLGKSKGVSNIGTIVLGTLSGIAAIASVVAVILHFITA